MTGTTLSTCLPHGRGSHPPQRGLTSHAVINTISGMPGHDNAPRHFPTGRPNNTAQRTSYSSGISPLSSHVCPPQSTANETNRPPKPRSSSPELRPTTTQPLRFLPPNAAAAPAWFHHHFNLNTASSTCYAVPTRRLHSSCSVGHARPTAGSRHGAIARLLSFLLASSA